MDEESFINNEMDDKIKKVSSIKSKVKMDIEKTQEKISRENAKIINQKVNQNATFWDLKEKLKEEKCNRNKLQQNIIELQMQYETISRKYQDELRLRADIINRVNKNQNKCKVLEEFERVVGNTLKRCENDKVILSKAYQDGAEKVSKHTVKYEQAKEKDCQIITALQNKVVVAREQQQHQHQLLNKEQSMSTNLHTEIKELTQQLNNQAFEANQIYMQQEMELRETREALGNQEMNLKNVNEKKVSLEKELNDQVENINNLLGNISELKHQLQESKILLANKNSDIEVLLEDQKYFLKELNDKENLKISHEKSLNVLKDEMKQMEIKHKVIISNLNKVIEEQNIKYKDDKEMLEIQIHDTNNNLEQMELDISNQRDSAIDKEKEILGRIEEWDKKTETEASAITELISELKIITEDKIYKENKIKDLECIIQECDKDIEAKSTGVTDMKTQLNKEVNGRLMLEKRRDQLKTERDEAFEQVEKLQKDVQDLKEDWSKKIVEATNTIRSEKDALQEKKQDCQKTLHNIRKTVNDAMQRHTFRPLESDINDNAVSSPIAFLPQIEDSMNLINLDSVLATLQEDSLNITHRDVAPTKGTMTKDAPQGAHVYQVQRDKRVYSNKKKTNFTNARKA